MRRRQWIIISAMELVRQEMNANTMVGLNVPMTYSNDRLNRFTSPPVRSSYPFLTYAAGSNGVSKVS